MTAPATGVMPRVILLLACAAGPLILGLHALLAPTGSDVPEVLRGGARIGGTVLLSVDALPAAAVRFFDEPGAPPALDALAQESIEVWLHHGAVTSEPAAATSLITGRLPREHRVRRWDTALDPGVPTLFDPFAADGRPTALVSNLPLASQVGLGRGVDHVVEQVGAGADALVAAARPWLAERTDDDGFLLWVHLHPGQGDAATAFEALVAGVVDGLRAARVHENTTLVATGTLGATGRARTGDPRTPLLVKLPRRTSGATVRVGPTSLLDLAPTLLDFMRLPALDGGVGRSLVDGRPMPLRSGQGLPGPVALEWLDPAGDVLVLRDTAVALTDEPGVYDLGADPRCLRNRHGSPAGEALGQSLGPAWEALRARLAEPALERTVPLDDGTAGSLRTLGLRVP